MTIAIMPNVLLASLEAASASVMQDGASQFELQDPSQLSSHDLPLTARLFWQLESHDVVQPSSHEESGAYKTGVSGGQTFAEGGGDGKLD